MPSIAIPVRPPLNKTPVVVLCQKNRKGFWIVAHEKDLDKVIKAKKQEK